MMRETSNMSSLGRFSSHDDESTYHRSRRGTQTSMKNLRKGATKKPIPKVFFLNLVLLSLSFLFVFTGFGGVQNLETSLELGDASGHIVVALIYIFFTIACVFAPKIVARFGSTMCMCAQELVIGLFIAAHFYPSSWTLYPTAILLGLGSAIMWIGQGEFVNFLAKQHSTIAAAWKLESPNGSSKDKDDVSGYFQGLFFCIFQCSQVTGNVISSLLFHSSGGNNPPRSVMNGMFAVYLICVLSGAALLFFCVGNTETLTKKQAELQQEVQDHVNSKRVSVEDGFSIAEKPEPGYEQQPEETTPVPKPVPVGLWDPFRLLKHPKMSLLVPIFFATGLQVGFAWGDLTENVIRPKLGSANIGFGMAIFGGFDALFSFILGRVSDKLGRPLIMAAGFVCHLCCCIALLRWFQDPVSGLGHHYDSSLPLQPSERDWASVGVLCAFWGFGDAVWNTTLSAMLGACFPASVSQAAFGVFRMFLSLGASLAFLYGNSVPVPVKLGVLIAVLVIAAVCYVIDLTVCGLERKTNLLETVAMPPVAE